MDFVQQLKVFVAVAENRSFARAAEALRMARPSVTNAINSLEEGVGARLLQRTTRRTALTAEGELFHDQAVRTLAAVSEARNLFGGSSERPRGRLRVDIPVAIARPIIIPALPDFRARYPDVDVVLGVSDQPVDLLAEGVDCVLRIGDLPATRMVGRVLAQLVMVICASPGYLRAHGTPATIDDLHAHEAVNYFSGRGHRPIPWSVFDGEEEREIRVKSGVLVNDTEAFVSCATAGLGLIQAPRTVVASLLEAGDLVEVLPQMPQVRRPLSVMYPAKHHLAPQVRAFIDWTAELFSTSRDGGILDGRPG